jgi:hypothetical protein
MSASSNAAQAARQPASRDSFARAQFEWLRQVAFDSSLPPTASRVAIALTQYFNRTHDGWAWMSQATLATDIGMPARTVRYALAHLIERGHLVTKRRGKMETSLYRLELKNSESDRQAIATHDRQTLATHDRQAVATHYGVTGKNQQSDRQESAQVTGKPLPTNPLNEPLEEPIEEESDSRRPVLVLEEGRREVGTLSTHRDSCAGFEDWWRQYPKRVAKAAALKAYRTVITKKLATVDELLAGAMRYAAEREGQDPRYTKHPATWLNGGCWADEAAMALISTIDEAGNVLDWQQQHHDRTPVNPHAARRDAAIAKMIADGIL